jgi:hypothetical protein
MTAVHESLHHYYSGERWKNKERSSLRLNTGCSDLIVRAHRHYERHGYSEAKQTCDTQLMQECPDNILYVASLAYVAMLSKI